MINTSKIFWFSYYFMTKKYIVFLHDIVENESNLLDRNTRVF